MAQTKPAKFNSLCVVGLGYIGLPTAVTFASRQLKVTGVDVRQSVVDTINEGKVHFHEPDLDMLLHAVVSEGWLKASLTPAPADAFIIAVPTPFTSNKDPDLSDIEAACRAIAPVVKKGDLVILESTSPVGATERVCEMIAAARPDLRLPHVETENPDVLVAHCPERVLPGQIMRELIENDRIVGGMTPKCARAGADLFRIFTMGECIETTARTAELCKLAENSFRDVNIAFANEMSVICEKLGINVWELIPLVNRHPRVNMLQPGAGVGGHCIAVDPWFIVSSAPEESRIIRTAREVNDAKPEFVFAQIEKAMNSAKAAGTSAPKIACLGIAFKPDVDDLRESPALEITKRLEDLYPGAILVVEPNLDEAPASLKIKKLTSLKSALDEADVIVCLVAHSAFKGAIAGLPSGKFVVDPVGLSEKR